MPLTAFLAQDRLSHKDTTIHFQEASLSSPASPYTNALDDRPRLLWQAPTPGYWSTPAMFLDINEGSGEVSVSLPTISQTVHNWALAMQNVLNLSALSHTYSVIYNATTARFTIRADGSNTFNILWNSGTHGGASGNNPRQWLGWTKGAADTGLANSHTAPEKRYNTELFIAFDLGSAKTVDALACILEAGDDASINDSDLSSVQAYGHSTLLSSISRTVWKDSASKVLTFSDQPSESENKIQVAFDTAGAAMTYRYWAFSWLFFDEDPVHGVGILKALKKYTTTTRQITQLAGHGLVDPTPPLGVANYYPAQSLERWQAPLNFNNWGATDYRNTVQAVVREGAAKGLVWSLRWDEVVDGTYDADDEADIGFLFWGAITEYSQGTYGGAGSSEFISGELTILQVR